MVPILLTRPAASVRLSTHDPPQLSRRTYPETAAGERAATEHGPQGRAQRRGPAPPTSPDHHFSQGAHAPPQAALDPLEENSATTRAKVVLSRDMLDSAPP